MLRKTCFIIIFLILSTNIVLASSNDRVLSEVIDVIDNVNESELNGQIIKVKILEGPYKDKIINLERNRIEYSLYNYDIEIGDTILTEVYLAEDNLLRGTLINIWRVEYLKQLGIIFLVLLVIFGGFKGIRSFISLVFTGFVIIKFLIPLILDGYDAVWVSVIFASIIIIVSFILITGFTKKSFVAIIGTVGGTFAAGILSQIYTNLSSITGLADENVSFLVSNIGIEIDFRGLYMSAIIIGTIGVIMDVSMSITSVIFEIKRKSPKIGSLELLHSGLSVGKDVMSTMVNTLVLAYVGGFMPLLLIFITSEIPLLQALNTELLAVEIIRSLCGSIGLILTIPFTCLVATYTVQRKLPYSL